MKNRFNISKKRKNDAAVCANCRIFTNRKESYKYVTLLQKSRNGYIIDTEKQPEMKVRFCL